jgi:hypothetical protein
MNPRTETPSLLKQAGVLAARLNLRVALTWWHYPYILIISIVDNPATLLSCRDAAAACELLCG